MFMSSSCDEPNKVFYDLLIGQVEQRGSGLSGS